MKILRKHQTEALDAISKHSEGIIHLPTGSGKTFIQATTIVENLNTNVFVVLSPRILLTNQLYNEIKSILISNKKDCQYLIVHSGKADDNSDLNWCKDLPYRDVNSTTSSIQIKEDYDRSVRENVPLVIFGTYDSADRIVKAGIPVYMLLCDEAHYLVTEEFSWIRYENYQDNRKQFNTQRKYYFTATLKQTTSDSGLGMNNYNEFGHIIYSKTPLDLVLSGDILRPRMHLVEVSSSSDTVSELDMDVNAIVESFDEHRINCNVGAKLLIVTKGSEHLNQIVNHPKIVKLLKKKPNLKIFDITSAHKPRINGVTVKRNEFLNELQSLTDADEAIILHVRILTEGIDVPGITGVMIMNDLSLSAFLQTLGRSTRLHKTDRASLYSGEMLYSDLDDFIKPFAWIIIPVYGMIGSDLRDNISSIVYSLRSFGFNASEDVVIKQSRGKALPVSLEQLNELDTRGQYYREQILDIVHTVEEKEIAEKLELEDFQLDEKMKNETLEETIARFQF